MSDEVEKAQTAQAEEDTIFGKTSYQIPIHIMRYLVAHYLSFVF